MGHRRVLIAGVAVALAAVTLVAAAGLAPPRRHVVEGVSMAPGLLPGDVVTTGWFPALDRVRTPRRFERWVVSAADGLAIKRVVGLPGEEVGIVDGDLVIDGAVVLKSTRLLAETGCSVPDNAGASPASVEAGWQWSRPADEILDDAPFDLGSPRVLAAVRDVGLTAVVDVRQASATDPADIRVRVGSTVVTRPLAEPGCHAIVAGRLDGRLVIATWRVPPGARAFSSRSCLPPAAPEAWQVADRWVERGNDRGLAPALAIDGGDGVTIVEVARWRDVAWRPGAVGRSAWTLGADEVFVLGDHPADSTDSRRWGPIKAEVLRQRIAGRAPPGRW